MAFDIDVLKAKLKKGFTDEKANVFAREVGQCCRIWV